MSTDWAEARPHFERFVRAFLQKWRHGRWLQLPDVEPLKWDMVGAAELWHPGYAVNGCTRRYKGVLNQLLAENPFAELLDRKIYLFRLGHDPYPGLRALKLGDLLEEDPVEAIVSIIPGKLGIALGHSDEVAVAERR